MWVDVELVVDELPILIHSIGEVLQLLDAVPALRRAHDFMEAFDLPRVLQSGACPLPTLSHSEAGLLVEGNGLGLSSIGYNLYLVHTEVSQLLSCLVIGHMVFVVLPVDIENFLLIIHSHTDQGIVRSLKAEVHTIEFELIRNTSHLGNHIQMGLGHFELRQDLSAVDTEVTETSDSVQVRVVRVYLIQLFDIGSRQEVIIVHS